MAKYGNLKANNLIFNNDDGLGDIVVPLTTVDGKANTTGATFTGNVVLDNDKEVRLSEADGNGAAYVGLKAPTDMGTDPSYTVTLPSAEPGANAVLQAGGSGSETTLTWGTSKADLAGDTFTGGVNLADGIKLTLGDAGNNYNPGSYEIYEDNDLYIKSNAGHMRHQVPAGLGVLLEGPTGSLAKFIEGGACELYYDDVKKLESTSAGVNVTGTVDATGAITSSSTITSAGDITSSAGVLGVGDAVLANDQTWTGAQGGAIVDYDGATGGSNPSVAATTDIDFSLGNNFYLDLADATVSSVTASNVTAGQSGSIIVRGHATNQLAGWSSDFKGSGGTFAPTFTADAAKYDRVDYFIHGANDIQVVWTGNY